MKFSWQLLTRRFFRYLHGYTTLYRRPQPLYRNVIKKYESIKWHLTITILNVKKKSIFQYFIKHEIFRFEIFQI